MALFKSILTTTGNMKSTPMKKVTIGSFLALIILCLANCKSSTVPGWQQKNNELIKQYDLAERKLSGLPETTIASNLEPGKVKSLDSLASVSLHPGVTAKIFWGSGNMVSTLQLEPGAKIPEEVLPADRFLFVLEGSIDQLIN